MFSYLAMNVAAGHYKKGIVDESPGASPLMAVGSSAGGSPLLAHLKRDIILLYREPTVAMQILPLILFVLLFPYLAGDRQPGMVGNMALSIPVAMFALMFGSQLGSRLIPMERLGFCWNLLIPGGNRLMLLGKFVLGLSTISLFMVMVGLVHMATSTVSGFEYIILLTAFSYIGFGLGLPISIVYGNFAWEHPKQMLKGGGFFIMIFLVIIAGFAIYLGISFMREFISPIILLPTVSIAILAFALTYSSMKLANFEWVSSV